MSQTFAAAYTVILPKAAQVLDPFHVISLANRSLDAVRRRVQSEQTGHRGRRDDPLYRARRVLPIGEEKLNAAATERLAHCSRWVIPQPKSPSPHGSRSACATSIEQVIPTKHARY
jgi:transposase